MAKSKEEYLDEKINLIYEFNTQSPLFSRIAKAEIDKNNLLSALSILENGIKLYPHHPTAYFILGELYIKTGDKLKAKEAFTNGSDLIKNSDTLNHYLKMLSGDSIDNNLSDLAEKLSKAKMPKPLESDFPISEEEPDFQITLFSETYADILASQSETDAAINIYTKLMEEQPHKADYFLKKINALKRIF